MWNTSSFLLWRGAFCLPGEIMGRENPLEAPGAELVRELARAGWDVPGFDTVIHTMAERDGRVRRSVSTVTIHETGGAPLILGFYNRALDGSYGLCSARWGWEAGAAETCFYADGSGSGRDRGWVLQAIMGIEKATERLRAIVSAPGHDDVTEEGDAAIRKLCHVEPIPAPEDFPPLYAWVEPDDAVRLIRDDPDEATVTYGLPGSGWRLLGLGVRTEGLGPRVTDGFTYASADPTIKASAPSHPVKEGQLPAEIRLRYLNDVYVMDGNAFETARQHDCQRMIAEGLDDFSADDVNGWSVAAAKTMVPYGEYDGSYPNPMVLIGRRTFTDEVRLMQGNISVIKNDEVVETFLRDDETGLDMLLVRSKDLVPTRCLHVMRTAEYAARFLGRKACVSPEARDLLEANPEPYLFGRP